MAENWPNSDDFLSVFQWDAWVGNVTLHMRPLHVRALLHMRVIFRNCFLEQRNCFLLFINNYFW